MNKIQKWIAKYICKIPEPEQKEVQFIHTEYPVIELHSKCIMSTNIKEAWTGQDFLDCIKNELAFKMSSVIAPYLIWSIHDLHDGLTEATAQIRIIDEYDKRRIN